MGTWPLHPPNGYGYFCILTFTCAQAAIKKDGIWTDHDLYHDISKIGVTNGIPYSNDPYVQRTLDDPKTMEGDIYGYDTKENVLRVKRVMEKDKFEYLFPLRDKVYTYEEFLKVVAKFPAICGESIDDSYTND